MDKLNEKLAKWVGFILVPIEHQSGEPEYAWSSPFIRGNVGTIAVELEPPGFTQSLDACFKWLVPKLVSGDIHIEWYATIDDTAVELKRATTTIAFVCQPSPAQALCLAIEKLISNKGGNEYVY